MAYISDPEDPGFDAYADPYAAEREHDGPMTAAERGRRFRLRSTLFGLKELRGIWLSPRLHDQAKALLHRFERMRTVQVDAPDAVLAQDQRIRFAAERLARVVGGNYTEMQHPAVRVAVRDLKQALEISDSQVFSQT
jgi:hypothetical protein